MTWDRVWMIVAALLLITAAVFVWRNNLSAAFVTAALGACAWFLSYRTQLRHDLPDDTDSGEEQFPEQSNED
jgi:hypothetical protein